MLISHNILRQIRITDFTISDCVHCNTGERWKMPYWNLQNQKYSHLLIIDGPTIHNRVLGQYTSDLDHEPRFPIHSSTNVVTIRYYVQSGVQRLHGQYVISYWRLEWNAEMESTKLVTYYKT